MGIPGRCGLNRAVLDNECSLGAAVDPGRQRWMGSTKGPRNCICCRRGIAEMPLRRFEVDHNPLLENPTCASMWTFNTFLVHTRYGISLHVPRLHSDGAPGPRLPIRACTPGQKINRLVGRCRSTPCDPHEQIYRYIVHSVPREPHHTLIPGPGRSVLHTLVPSRPLLAGLPFSRCPREVYLPRPCPASRSGVCRECGEGGAVRHGTCTGCGRHVSFDRVAPHIMTELSRRSSCLSPSTLYCVRQSFRVRSAGLGRKWSNFRADETQRNVTMNLDFFIDLRLAHPHP